MEKQNKMEKQSIIEKILWKINKHERIYGNVNYDYARYLADNYLDYCFQIYNAERYNVDLLDSIMYKWEEQNNNPY